MSIPKRVGTGIYLGDFPKPYPLAEPGYLKKIAGLGCDDRISGNYIR